MKSTTLALSLVALISAFAALDLSGVHPAGTAGAGLATYSVIPQSDAQRPLAAANADADEEEEELEAQLVNAFLVTDRVAEKTTAKSAPMLTPAAHRCVTTTGTPSSGSAQYCFGAPAPLIYD